MQPKISLIIPHFTAEENVMKKSHATNIAKKSPTPVLGQYMTTRRAFAKKALGIGFLSPLTMMNAPATAFAWLDGKFHERNDLGDALEVLVKTYSDTRGYPHKFNDALVKLHLRNLDFMAGKGLHNEYANHYVEALGALINKYIKKGVEKFGKDVFLWGTFERTSCSYQLYEHIDIKNGERSFPCPYKNILGHIQQSMGTYKITWDDVCTKWCTPVWKGFAKKAGDVEIEVHPGNTCKVKVL
jgi:hypothetical protein